MIFNIFEIFNIILYNNSQMCSIFLLIFISIFSHNI